MGNPMYGHPRVRTDTIWHAAASAFEVVRDDMKAGAEWSTGSATFIRSDGLKFILTTTTEEVA
jgi:hypothetical protein